MEAFARPLTACAGERTAPMARADNTHGGCHRFVRTFRVAISGPPPSSSLRAADERAGACSILVGIAANRSLETRTEVRVEDLVGKLARPDYTPMPGHTGPVPMPPRVG